MKQILIASTLFYCLFLVACGTGKAVTTDGNGSNKVEVSGKFRSTKGVMKSLSCYCSDGGYLTTDAGESIAVCFKKMDKFPEDCLSLTVKGTYQTLKNNPEPTSPCPKGEMKVLMAESFNNCVNDKLDPENIKRKPIIYLYPTEEMEVNVQLDHQGKLLHTYPKYNPQTGWEVTAQPNGDLVDSKTGKKYYALYWEGQSETNYDLSKGFVVEGSKSADFLNEKLAILGLNRRETNEFMVYWLPELEKNRYNLIHFAQESYTDVAGLKISPKPETLIRVFMVFQPLKKQITVEEQQLKSIKRKGFTAVEWGGSKLPELAN